MRCKVITAALNIPHKPNHAELLYISTTNLKITRGLACFYGGNSIGGFSSSSFKTGKKYVECSIQFICLVENFVFGFSVVFIENSP